MAEEVVSDWGLLPHTCLLHVFRFLPNPDRRSADMVCHRWHKVMRSPSLWRFRCFHFSGRMSRLRRSEYQSAVTYAQYLGVYLERLEVRVCPPRRSLAAERLERVITGLFSELTRVRAPLRSLSLVRLELDRSAWTTRLRRSLIDSLIHFLQRGASKLTSVCLRGMRNRMYQGLELLSALSDYQQRLSPQCCISFLCLDGFFYGNLRVHLDPSLPGILSQLRGVTDLRLSYSCLSDKLLMTLQEGDSGVERRNSSRDGNPLQALSLYCSFDEPHRQLVWGESWAALASSLPDLRVKLTVDQVINTDGLARILLREIPLTEFLMTAFYSSREHWSARPLLSDMLPQYRSSLQYLNLDLINYNESLDEELLQLVKMCERLEKLRVWAFLEIRTVERLLEIRLTQRRLLNKIKVRIYSEDDIATEQEVQLEELLSSYQHLPPELDFFAKVYPFV